MLICYLERRQICCKKNELKRGKAVVNYRVSHDDVQGEDSDVENEHSRVRILIADSASTGAAVSNSNNVSQLMTKLYG